MLKINEKVPDFEVDAFYEDEIKKIKFSDYRGEWMALVFYPADFTFVCPTELEEMADLYDQFRALGAEVLSVSRDTAYVHKAWHDTSEKIKKIRFPMLADTTTKLCNEFGTYIENEGVSLRASFIIDPDGMLKAIEMHDNSFGRSGKELLRKLEAAKFVRDHKGNVCPASWEPGDETIKPSMDLIGKL
ncbi:MAG TPA: redoxin domain-containing protein [Methanocella sp.]